MCQHVKHRHLGKTEYGILKDREVHAVNSSQDLLFEFLAKGGSKCQFGNGGLVKADAFGNQILGLRGWDVWCVARVYWELKDSTGKCLVGLCSHDQANVTMAATTVHRGNSMGISIDFLCQQLDCSVGGCANDGGEFGMGESKTGSWHGHG